MPFNIGERLVLDTFVTEGSVIKNRVCIIGSAGASIGGTTKMGAVRLPLTDSVDSLAAVGVSLGSCAGSAQLIPILVLPSLTAAGGTAAGTEIPAGIAQQTKDPNLVVTVAIVGSIVLAESDEAIRPARRVGATGTHGRIGTF